jgi:SpoVK/Ycf46/Vps4 family AAA+-type ATPase
MSSTSKPVISDTFPAWARRLSEKYYSQTIALFVITGNVHDLVPVHRNGRVEFVSLSVFLNQALFGGRDVVVNYDRGSGVTFARPEMQSDFARVLEGYDSYHGTTYAKAMPRNPDGVLTILGSYMRVRVADSKKIAAVVNFAETVVPAGEIASMSTEDRNALVMIKRWAQDPAFLRADVTICLVAENESELNQSILRHPNVAAISIPLPDEAERLEFVRARLEAAPLPEGSDISPEALAAITAGLKRVHLDTLLRHAVENQVPLTTEFLSQRKKELIEAESGGLLEFVQSRFTLNNVAGHDPVKKKLRNAAAALKAGRLNALPMGYVVCGPVGTGKSFLTSCFAGEVGIPAVMLKNFRSQWQGVTEANLEHVLTLLRAMGPIIVIVDEADAQLGDRSNSGDSGVSNRVFAQIAQFMGNTEMRGHVIWFLLTCRPDLLPVDLKRQGRAEEHIALFYPDTESERLDMFRAMQKKTGTALESAEVEKLFLAQAGALSGADVEALLVRARMLAGTAGKAQVGVEELKAAIEDFIPPSYPEEIELQNLAAVIECTSRSLLPERYRTMDRAEITRRAIELSLLRK